MLRPSGMPASTVPGPRVQEREKGAFDGVYVCYLNLVLVLVLVHRGFEPSGPWSGTPGRGKVSWARPHGFMFAGHGREYLLPSEAG